MTAPPLRALFEAALALPEAERGVYLDAHCPDPAARARLERMLSEWSPTTPPDLPVAPAGALSDAMGDDPLPLPGTRVGPFELVELLGEGGYSTVFHAVREQDGVRQDVALKLLRSAIFTPQARRQFQREHQALAQLQHPNIAALIEGGITASGQGYLALELVDGLPITDYARQHALGLRERMRLFVDVCRAVASAHRALVVHRDLKPANVLVTAQGRVKLIDFGVAKLIDGDEATLTFAPGFTPAYAAPEQHRGEPVTTATDVYSLGVLLGELVTGTRLNDGSGRTPSSRVASSSPATARDAPPGLKPGVLRGDLDNIVMKAIEAEPQQRYASAAALADDIEAHLAGLPVNAHPPSRLYRARKFVNRHRGGVAATIAFCIAVFASLALALWQARVARNQAHRAAEVQRFVEAMFDPLESGNYNEQTPSLQQLLQRGVQRIEDHPPDDPAVRAELLGMFARINDGMGEVRDNVALAERAWQASLATWGPDDPRSIGAQAVFGKVLRKDGQYQRALEVLEPVVLSMQRDGIGGTRYAAVLESRLHAQRALGSMTPEHHLALRLEILRLRQGDPEATPLDLASSYNNVGDAHESVRNYESAADAYRRAYELRHATLGDSAAAAISLSNLGNTFSWRGQWQRAIDTFEQARAMYGRARISGHPNFAGLLVRFCDLYSLRNELHAARADCDAALQMAEDVLGTENAVYAAAVLRHAGYLLAAGDEAAAAARFAEARAIHQRLPGNAASRARMLDSSEAFLWRVTGDVATLRERLIPVADQEDTRLYWSAPLVYAWLAWACEASPSPECGDRRRREAEWLLQTPRFATNPLRLPAYTALARIDLAHGNNDAAIDVLRRELDAATELDPMHPWRGEALLVLSQALPPGPARITALTQARGIASALPDGHYLRRWVQTPP